MSGHDLVALHDTPHGVAFECQCGERGKPLKDVKTTSGQVVFAGEEWSRSAHAWHVDLLVAEQHWQDKARKKREGL